MSTWSSRAGVCAFLLSLFCWHSAANALDMFEILRGRPVGIFAAESLETAIAPCAGVLVSQTHLLHTDCRGGIGEGKLRVLLGNEVPLSPFDVYKVVESGVGWQISRIDGRPSSFFGVTSIGKAPAPGESLNVLTFVKSNNGTSVVKRFKKCFVERYFKGSQKQFSYSCNSDDLPKSSYPQFIYRDAPLQQQAELVAIQQQGMDVAIPIETIRQKSKILSKIPFQYKYGASLSPEAININCEKAGYYASHPEELLAFSPWKYDEIVAILRACAEQMIANRWKPPENRTVTVIRNIRREDRSIEYILNSISKDDINQIVYSCWFSRDQEFRNKLLSEWIYDRTVPETPLNCSGVLEGLRTNEPLLLETTDSSADAYFYKRIHEIFPESTISNVWDDIAPLAKIEFDKPSQNDPRVTVGKIYERCLVSWDDSFNFHSLRFEGFKPIVRMKKLRHCMQMTATGPIDAKHIAKEIISTCVDRALNDDKTRHILTLILGIAADILSAGGTGGAVTIGALTDYLVEVQERALTCLTDEKQLQTFVVETLRGSFGADVKWESHWIFWDS